MPRNNSTNTISGAAGLSGGTGFAGLVLLMPDGVLKSVLLILAPTITIVISNSWNIVTQEIEGRVADWRIRMQRKKAQQIYDALKSDKHADPSIIEKAKQTLDALASIEVEIAKRRVDQIVAS